MMGSVIKPAFLIFCILICTSLVTLLGSKRGFAVNSLIKEFVLPEVLSSPDAILVDPSGRVWFSEKIGKNLSVFDPDKETFKLYPLPPSWGNVSPSRIAFGQKGDIWFTINRWAETLEDTNILGEFITSEGSFKKYSLSTQAVPDELIVDARGIVWFLAGNENKLYQFNPADATLKGYEIPSPNSSPRGMAIDDNDNIWFAEANTNKIGVFIPGKDKFHEFEIPTPFANPGDIALDIGSGRVWFSQISTNRLGMLYPDKDLFNEAEIPTPKSLPMSLVIDEDGNVWFLEYRGNKVGVFNPVDAVFREFDIPTFNSLPRAMVFDHERGRLWFSETDTDAKRLGVFFVKRAFEEKE